MKGPTPYRLPDDLPPLHTDAWRHVVELVVGHLQSDLQLAGAAPVRASRLLVAHPSQTPLIELIRSIHNGDLAPAEDADGRPQPLPRAWRCERHWHTFWIMETTGPAESHRLACWSRDQALAAA